MYTLHALSVQTVHCFTLSLRLSFCFHSNVCGALKCVCWIQCVRPFVSSRHISCILSSTNTHTHAHKHTHTGSLKASCCLCRIVFLACASVFVYRYRYVTLWHLLRKFTLIARTSCWVFVLVVRIFCSQIGGKMSDNEKREVRNFNCDFLELHWCFKVKLDLSFIWKRTYWIWICGDE